jgi:hypothetical protein
MVNNKKSMYIEFFKIVLFIQRYKNWLKKNSFKKWIVKQLLLSIM